MVDVFAFSRSAVGLACGLLAILWSASWPAQTIDLSLNVYYAASSNANSGGTWELIAKSSGFGIAGITARVKDVIGGTIVEEAPRATFNGNPAGFNLFATPAFGAGRNIIVFQQPNDAGQPQGLFYGVGTLSNGTPGSIGPAMSPLTGAQDIPWAVVPVPPPADTLPNSNDWLTAARFASGTFATGVTPSFMDGSEGNVFLSVGTSTVAGTISDAGVAAVNVFVRTNLQPLPDYNLNGKVDAADYVLWRNTLGPAPVPPGSGADGNNNGTIDLGDYTVWRSNFGLPPGAGAGSGAGLSSGIVPEPASFVCLLIAAAMMLMLCRKQLVLSPAVARRSTTTVRTTTNGRLSTKRN